MALGCCCDAEKAFPLSAIGIAAVELSVVTTPSTGGAAAKTLAAAKSSAVPEASAGPASVLVLAATAGPASVPEAEALNIAAQANTTKVIE